MLIFAVPEAAGMKERFIGTLLLFVATSTICVHARIHLLNLKGDNRRKIDLLSFGFQHDGHLNIDVQNYTLATHSRAIGFSLSRGEDLHDKIKSRPDWCVLEDQDQLDPMIPVVLFIYDFKQKKLNIVRRSEALDNIVVCQEKDLFSCGVAYSRNSDSSSEAGAAGALDGQNATAGKTGKASGPSTTHLVTSVPLVLTGLATDDASTSYSFQVSVFFSRGSEEGYYHLMYHNCYNYHVVYFNMTKANAVLTIIARNGESFLGAGELPYPNLYFTLAAFFFGTFIVWSLLLKATKENVFKIHYLMAALVFLKSMSLLFHGVNFYFISKYGHQQEVWAVVYYIMHLLKGALLFGVVVLIGTGWTFFKNFLTDRDKRILVFVIPLQVLDNIALIIVEETEEGDANFRFWWQVFIFVDLVCCAAIILPVIWSIRHLQEASQTDGKAAFNLGKVKLFRQFYILVICYIYLTRIIKYLVTFTVPFKYEWGSAIVEEVGTWLFFIITGYNFKPAPNNPYLQLSQSDDDLEMDEVLTESGLLEGVVRIKKPVVPKRKGNRDEMQNGGAESVALNSADSHELVD